MCEKCNDTYWIEQDGFYVECECQKEVHYLNSLRRAGINPKSIDGFKADGELTALIKKKAIEYISKGHSLMLLGKVGSGKTHLATAVCTELVQSGKSVRAINYRDTITFLKQIVTDRLDYQSMMRDLKNVEVLFIDDLYKGKVTDADINYIYEIINYRYNNRLKVIITSEKTLRELEDIDEAMASRIAQMCGEYILEFKGMANKRSLYKY